MTDPNVHVERAHSPYGPSSLARIVKCRGSVRAQIGWPERPTVAAQEGSAAHTFVEHILESKGDEHPRSYVGGKVDLRSGEVSKEGGEDADDFWSFEITDEMAAACELYCETVAHWFDEASDELDIEVPLDLGHIKAGAFGTSDVLIYKPAERHLVVIDLKYGRGKVVEVRNNVQLSGYASGAVRRLHNRGVDRITLVIVQPRAPHPDGPVRTCELDPFDLSMIEDDMRDAANESDDPNATRVASDECFFCRCMNCETLERAVIEALSVDWEEWKLKGEAALKPVSKMTPDELGKAIRSANLINGYFRRLEKFAHDEAVNGNVPTGCKLVAKQGRRKWTSSSDAEEYLRGKGLDDSDIFDEPKMKTPAGLEKALGKRAAAKLDLDQFVSKQSSGFTLTIEEDPRERVALADEGDDFGVPADV